MFRADADFLIQEVVESSEGTFLFSPRDHTGYPVPLQHR